MKYPVRSDLTALIEQSITRVDAMTPEERGVMHRAQRASFVRGEAGMGSDADEVEYAEALRAGDQAAIADCKRRSRERVARAEEFMRERGML